MKIETILCGELMENCYILHQEGREDCIVIDPGDAWPVLDYLDETKQKAAAILLTHGHFDHIGGVFELKERTGAEVFIHALDADKLSDNRKNLAAFMGGRVSPAEADVLIKDGDIIEKAGVSLRVIHTPGHSSGGVCYLVEAERSIFCGDTIFLDSCGRTDFPDGDEKTLYHSIADKLFTLPGDYTLYPGHNETTTMEHERRGNPLVAAGKRWNW